MAHRAENSKAFHEVPTPEHELGVRRAYRTDQRGLGRKFRRCRLGFSASEMYLSACPSAGPAAPQEQRDAGQDCCSFGRLSRSNECSVIAEIQQRLTTSAKYEGEEKIQRGPPSRGPEHGSAAHSVVLTAYPAFQLFQRQVSPQYDHP